MIGVTLQTFFLDLKDTQTAIRTHDQSKDLRNDVVELLAVTQILKFPAIRAVGTYATAC